MENSKRKIASQYVFILYLLTSIIILSAGTSLAADQMIARLTAFSGQVMIKSNGQWGLEPRKNLPLFSQDKVVTRTGRATITFLDGAVLEIRPNSNLLIQETEEVDPSTNTKIVKRKLRLLLGKLLFRTGKLKNRTVIQTPTAVCGLRGTECILSTDAAGLPYIQFIEGGTSYIIGDFITGVAQDIPAEIADLNPAQKAALIAHAAAKQAKYAETQAKAGEITNNEALLKAAEAAEAAAREAKAAAEAMLNNPDPEVQAEARMAVIAAEKAIKAAQEAQEAIKRRMRESDETVPLGDAEAYTDSGVNGPPIFPNTFPGPPLPLNIPPNTNAMTPTLNLTGQNGGGDVSNGFWLLSYHDDNTTTLRFLTNTTFGTGIAINSNATVEDLGSGAWQPTQGQWSLTETPLTMAGIIPDTDIGHIGIEEGGLYEYPGFVDSGDMEGLLGWSLDPWIDNSHMHAMGNIVNHGNSIFYGDAFGGSFEGIMGGIIYNDDLEALLSAVAVDDQGRAGLLSAKFLGKSHKDISIFDMDGLSDWTVMNQNIGFPQAELNNHIYKTSDSWRLTLTGKFNGSTNSNIQIANMNSGSGGYGNFGNFETISIVNNQTNKAENWGVFGATLGGTFENPDLASRWQSYFGGEAEFGGHGDGFFLAKSSSTWADGKLSASINGKFLTPGAMGDLDGNILGTYRGAESGVWEAIALGSWEGVQNDRIGYLGDYYSGLFLNGNVVGDIWGLTGVVFDPNNVNYSALSIGKFQDYWGAGDTYAWGTRIYSDNTKLDEDTVGIMGGNWMNGNVTGKAMVLWDEGNALTLPSSHRAMAFPVTLPERP